MTAYIIIGIIIAGSIGATITAKLVGLDADSDDASEF